MKARKMLILLLLFAILLPLASCSRGYGFYQSVYYDLFDTVTVIRGYARNATEFNSSVSVLYEGLSRCHKLFDAYKEYDGISNIATVNKNAGASPVTVDKEIIELLEYSKQLCESTSGAFDCSMGALTGLWKDASERAEQYKGGEGSEAETEAASVLPTPDELERASELTGFEYLEIDKENSTVFITKEGVSLDLGAIAKGYAGDIALEILKESSIKSAVLSLGGNVCLYGENMEKDGLWTVGVQSPFGEGSMAELRLTDKAVVTSGDYQRYFTLESRKYHHIIDPETLYPSEKFVQVTVICHSSALADALSTALFVTELEEGMALAEKLGVQVIWVESDGRVTESEGIRAYKQ